MANPNPARNGITGQFIKGHDPRRSAGLRVLKGGATLATLAREYTEDAVNLLASVVRGVDPETHQPRDYEISDRIKATEHILNRGWGRAVTTVQVEQKENVDINDLNRAALLAIATGRTIDAAVLENVQEDDEDISDSD